MNISEKINYYADNMSPKFVKINIIKMCQTFRQIKRYVDRELNDNRNIQFTSDDLRRWAISANKVFKKMQRDTEFDKFRDDLFSEGLPTVEHIRDVATKTKQYLTLVQDLQILVHNINYYATAVYLLEERYKKAKQDGDELFNDVVLAALVEAW